MKATGIVRQIDPLGRLVLPKELRETFSLKEGDSLEIFVDNECIALKPYKPGCIFCDEISDLVSFNGQRVCKECLKKIKALK